MNRDSRSRIPLYLFCLFVGIFLCLGGITFAQDSVEPTLSETLSEGIDSTETEAQTPTPEPEPTATLDPEVQKQQDIQTGLVMAATAPLILPDSELAQAIIYESTNETVYLRSDQPYQANTLRLTKFIQETAIKLSVRFAADFSLENGYDTLGIYYYDGELNSYRLLNDKTFSGNDLAGETVDILGNSVVFRFETDESVELSGWQVAEILPELPESTSQEVSENIGATPDSSESPSDEAITPETPAANNPESESADPTDAPADSSGLETNPPNPTAAATETAIPTITPMIADAAETLRTSVIDSFQRQFSTGSVSEIFVEEIKENGFFAAGFSGKYAVGENSGPEVYVFIARHDGSDWEIYFEGSGEFTKMLPSIPEDLLPLGISKDNLSNANLKGNGANNYSLPWATGEQWKLTGGPHRNNTAIAGQAWSALDFQGTYSVNNVRAVHAGTVSIIPGCNNFVLLSHPDGSKTGYYHLANIQVSNGQHVERGTFLGNTSQQAGCGGYATGPHVHFSVRNAANAGIDIRTLDIGGWNAISHGAEYSGCMVRNSDGYQACKGTANTIHNDGATGSGSGSPPPSNNNCPATTATEAYICVPELSPAPGDQCSTFWYPFTGFNGHPAYLTENAQSAGTHSNYGIWRPNLIAAGTYRVEAFIASHPPMNIPCNWGTASLHRDTSQAHYVIYHANGENTVVANQLPLDNSWLNLGEYFFHEGTNGAVLLRDLTGEAQASTNVSFSAVRFVLVAPAPNPIPSITSIDPPSAPNGNPAIDIHVYGSNFVAGASVYWNGSARNTSFINSNHLIAAISAGDLQNAGTANISVVNPAPGGGESNRVNFNIKPSLGKPTISPITRVSATSLRVSWNAIPGATGYRLWRSETSPSSGYGWVANVGNLTTVVTSVPSTKKYYYRVAALSGSDVGPLSAPVAGTTAINAPKINPITRVSVTSLRVSWNAIPGATGYRLWRSETSPSSGYGWVANVGNVTTVVTSVPSTKKYYYRVAALFGSTVGQLSAPVAGTTAINAPKINPITRVSATNLRVSWNAIPGATGYRLWRSETSPSSGYGWVANVGNVTAVVTSVPSTKTYHYRVAALFGSNVGTLSAPAAGTTALGKPTLKPSENLANGVFRLSWNSVLGADSYILYRSETGPYSGYGFAVNIGKKTSIETTSPNIYKRYYYKVAGVFNGQVGPTSNIISAMHNPVTFRALSIGEAAYNTDSGYNPLDGTIRDSVQMRNALSLFKYGQTRYTTNIQAADLSKLGVFAQISSAFAGSDPNDVSLFFFSGHGDYRGGISYIAAIDGSFGSEISSYELRAALDTVPGTTFVLIDACHSGGMIGRNGGTSTELFDAEKFANGFNAAFSGSPKQLNAQGYYVITAAASHEASGEWEENGIHFGIFTKALLEGIGWNHLSGSALSTMLADVDKDGIVNFSEAFFYARETAKRVNPDQTAQIYPYGATPLFYTR